MISILSSFKPFDDADALRQKQALASWHLAFPGCEIIAFGLPSIPSAVMKKYSIRQVTNIPMYNERLVAIDAMLQKAANIGRYDLQMYVNGDIILGPDFCAALKKLPTEKFLCVGQRYDVNDGLPEISSISKLERVVEDVRSKGSLHQPTGMDYFVFPRGAFDFVEHLYVGTVGWDNYMVGYALNRRMKVIDLTPSVVAVHQNHGYPTHPGGREEFENTEISQYNRKLMHDSLGSSYIYSTKDSTHEMADGKMVPARTSEFIEKRVCRLNSRYPKLRQSRVPWKIRYMYCLCNLYAGTGERGL